MREESCSGRWALGPDGNTQNPMLVAEGRIVSGRWALGLDGNTQNPMVVAEVATVVVVAVVIVVVVVDVVMTVAIVMDSHRKHKGTSRAGKIHKGDA